MKKKRVQRPSVSVTSVDRCVNYTYTARFNRDGKLLRIEAGCRQWPSFRSAFAYYTLTNDNSGYGRRWCSKTDACDICARDRKAARATLRKLERLTKKPWRRKKR